MDSHVLTSNLDNDQKKGRKSSPSLLKRFLPLLLLAVVLPFFVLLALVPPKISVSTEAGSETELRIWVEPANVVMSKGTTTEMTVMAQYDGDKSFIPAISLELLPSSEINLESGNLLKYSVPFKGKVELGKISVSAVESGSGIVAIPEDSVDITAFDGPLTINTASAKVVVR